MFNQRSEKVGEERSCNCRNSKCQKLYCECYSAGMECNKSCRCSDCQNLQGRKYLGINNSNNKPIKQEFIKEHKGCSCRKSFCVKKYCECYQEGILCNENCKCVDCQNNESMANRNVIIDLKKQNSNNLNKPCSLYPIVLSQNSEQINQIAMDQNLLGMRHNWLEDSTEELFKIAKEANGDVQKIIEALLYMLRTVDNKVKIDAEKEVDPKIEEEL